jgi:hypothetical protein
MQVRLTQWKQGRCPETRKRRYRSKLASRSFALLGGTIATLNEIRFFMKPYLFNVRSPHANTTQPTLGRTALVAPSAPLSGRATLDIGDKLDTGDRQKRAIPRISLSRSP